MQDNCCQLLAFGCLNPYKKSMEIWDAQKEFWIAAIFFVTSTVSMLFLGCAGYWMARLIFELTHPDLDPNPHLKRQEDPQEEEEPPEPLA
jgi:hypothetical protein